MTDFATIDAHVADYEPQVAAQRQALLTGAPADVSPVYRAVRPVLVMVSALPFLPARWRDPVALFVALMDRLIEQATAGKASAPPATAPAAAAPAPAPDAATAQ
jgi:hypothetical protein